MPKRTSDTPPNPRRVITRPASRKVRKALANLLVNFSGETRQTAKDIVFQCLVLPLQYELGGVFPKPPKGKKRTNQAFHTVEVSKSSDTFRSFKSKTLVKSALFICSGNKYKLCGYIAAGFH